MSHYSSNMNTKLLRSLFCVESWQNLRTVIS